MRDHNGKRADRNRYDHQNTKEWEIVMRILLINHYAGSVYHGMEFRPYYMAREWVKSGNEVVIAAADFSHLRKKNPQIDHDFTKEVIDGITYLWVKTPKYHGNGVMRAVNIEEFYRKMKSHAKKLAEEFKPEAIIASSTYPFDIYLAARIAQYSGGRVYFEIHDLWPLTQIEIYKMKTTNPYVKMLQNAEDYAFKNSHKIISILPQADRHIRERGFDASKFVCVPNGVIPSEAQVNAKPDECEQVKTLSKLREEGYFTVAYTGNHASANALEYFIDAAAIMSGEKVKFVLVGGGNEKDALVALAKEKAPGTVLFLNPVAKDDMGALLAQVDAAYMGLAKCGLFHYGVSPNKLYDYMLAARPVIYAVEASNNPVGDADCGVTVPVGEPETIVGAVRKLMAMSENERRESGERGRKYVLKNHDYAVLAQKYLDALR
jgi:glycosyltransferase involved in cell wall biosynthesis